MAKTTVRMYDSGINFFFNIKDESGAVNLSTVQNLEVYFQKPDKSVIMRFCSTVNAASGLIKYVSQPSDFDQAGVWSVQILVRFSNNNTKHSDIGTILVEKNLIL